MKIFDESGRQWPIFLISAFVFIAALCSWTVWVAVTNPVHLSSGETAGYKRFQHSNNDTIYANIEFNKRYKIEYITEQFKSDNATIKLKVEDVDGKAIDDATIELRLTHPFTHEYDKELSVLSVKDGVYTFEQTTLPTQGRWNIIVNIQIDKYYRILKLKVDTRNNSLFEY